jgi:DNA-binding HxlR family transcriptional regulator
MVVSYILNTGAELVGKKWRAVVIWYLIAGPKRFSQLKRDIPDVSVKMLSEVLQEMESNELIVRKQYQTIPVKVTYEIHPEARAFVEANVVCTIRIGEYIIQNHKKMNVPADTLALLKVFVKDHCHLPDSFKTLLVISAPLGELLSTL